MPKGEKTGYNRFLLLVAGLGGLLYGVDVGIIAGALPYLEATSGLNSGQLSIVVAAVLLGSVISTLFAGLLADWMGRKPLMTLSGVLFVISIPVIALAQGYRPLVSGTVAAGRQRGIDRRGCASLSGGVPVGGESRQGYGNFPMAADAGNCGGSGRRNVFQHPGRPSGEARRSGAGCLRSKTLHGAAFSGFHCRLGFCL